MVILSEKAPVLYEISQFINPKHKIDEATIHQAKLVIADTIGTAFSGVNSKAFSSARLRDLFLSAENEFDVWGNSYIRTSYTAAVFYNTLSISSTDFDEGHRKAVGHPASLVVPVAVLLGQKFKRPFSHVLEAVIIGYEVGTRFSQARVREKINSYSTGRWGGIATAATAAYLLGLTDYQKVHALSNAAVLSPAMLGGSTDVSTGSMSKEGVAWAAQVGLQSALIAKNGFTGPYLFVDETDDYHKDILVENLGIEWLINSNYFKPYACCRWLHPAIKAVLALREENNLYWFRIRKIEVEVFSRALDLISTKYPEDPIEAQFHLPYVLACALRFNKVIPEFFAKEYLKMNEISTLIQKISLIPSEQYSNAFPGKLQSKVTIELPNGKIFSKEILEAPWEAGSHPTETELWEKFKLQAGDKNEYIFKRIMECDENEVLDFNREET
ncbi:MAG TPA: MmgE/PrpD family protein [Bacteroidales bacterium]